MYKVARLATNTDNLSVPGSSAPPSSAATERACVSFPFRLFRQIVADI